MIERVPRTEQAIVRAISGGMEPLLRGRPIAVDADSLALHTLRTGGPVVVADWEQEQVVPAPPLALRYSMRSSAAVVVGPPEAPLGVLSVHAAEPGRLNDEGVAFMATVANILANAAERLRAEAELAEQAAARGRLVAQALDAEDRTRRGISEALHDGPLQNLLALGHDVSRLRPDTDDDEQHLVRVRDGLARAVQQIRKVMLDLHPVALQVGGLEPALKAISAQHSRLGGYECWVEIDPAASGPRDELVLSIGRELLRNVAKHANASNVQVSVRRSGNATVLEVIDDGIGIAPGRLQQAPGEGHIGVASSVERAEAIGGSLRVGSRTDGFSGTRAVAVLPEPAAQRASAPETSRHQARSPEVSARLRRRRTTF